MDLTLSSSERLEVEAGEDIIRKVYTEVHDGILEIGIRNITWHLGMHEPIKVLINAIQVESLSTSSGATVMGTNILKGRNLNLDASSGSSIKINIQEEALQANASSGGGLAIQGNTDNEEFTASSGSSIKSRGLISQYSRANASSGAEIQLTARKSLSGNASSGGSIIYSGNPAQVNKDKSSGGSIEPE